MDLFYCLLGIVGSFLISLFFYWLSNNCKWLLIDLVADDPRDKMHNCVLCMKSIGGKTIFLSDFANKDRPHILTEGVESFQTIPPHKANINNIFAEKVENDIFINFDYLKPKEEIKLILHGQKGIAGYRATMIEGKTIFYADIKRVLSVIRKSISFAGIFVIIMLLICLNVRMKFFSIIVGFLIGTGIIANLAVFKLTIRHNNLLKKASCQSEDENY